MGCELGQALQSAPGGTSSYDIHALCISAMPDSCCTFLEDMQVSGEMEPLAAELAAVVTMRSRRHVGVKHMPPCPWMCITEAKAPRRTDVHETETKL